MPQKSAVSQHYFLFGTQWFRMFLFNSPFTRKTGNNKINLWYFFLTEVNMPSESRD